MTTFTGDAQDGETYRVFLLRLWRDTSGLWHAVLQPANAAAPHHFADMDALIAFLKKLVPADGAAAAQAASGKPETKTL